MKYIITTILFLIALTTSAQVRDKQLKVDSTTSRPRPVSTPRVYIMASDTSAGALYNTGKWVDRDSFGLGDFAFYELGTTNPVQSPVDSAERSGYTLFTGLSGGLATKIEMLKEGTIQFDIDSTSVGGSGNYILRVKPLQLSYNNANFNLTRTINFFPGDPVSDDGIAFGLNAGVNGSEDPTQKALYWNWESHFTVAGKTVSELHLVKGDTLGNNYRVQTWYLDDGDTDLYNVGFGVDKIYAARASLTDIPMYFEVLAQDGAQTSLRLHGADSEGGKGIDFFVNTTDATELFQIAPYGTMPSSTEMYVNSFAALNMKRARISDDWGTHQGSNGNPAYLFGGESLYGGVVRVSWLEAIDSLISNGILTAATDWYKIGTTDAPTSITDNRYFTGNLAIGATTARGPLDVDNIYIGAAGVTHGYIRSADGIYFNSDYDNNGGDGSINFQNSGTSLLSIADNGQITASQYNGSPFTGTPFGIITHESDGDLISSGAGWGLSFSGGNLIADSSEVATKYDLTLISGAGDDWGADVVNTDLTLTGDGTAGNVLKVDTSEIATQFDISGLMDNWLLAASGTGGTESISDNETATITGAGINVATRSGANVTVTGTEVDGSITNEIQDITLTGSNPYVLDLSDDATDVTFAGAGIVTLSEGVANTLTITGTEVDGSVTNEAWTIDGDAGDTEVISNQTVLFDGTGIVTTTYTAASNTLTIAATEVDGSTTNELNTIEEDNVSVQTGNSTIDFQTMFDVAVDVAGEVDVSLDLSEATTVTSAESDDYIILYDNGSSQHQKILWPDILTELIEFEDGDVSVGAGSTIDVGNGLDINMVSSEANINLDPSEFWIDNAADGTEYVIIHDTDTTAGHRIQQRLVSSFGGADGNGIFDAANDGSNVGNSTYDVGVPGYLNFDSGTFHIDGSGNMVGIGTTSPDYLLDIESNSANVHIKDLNGGSGGQISIESVQETGIVAGISFQYTDSDYSGGTLQQTHQITAERQTDDKLHSIITIDAQDGTDTDVFAAEKNEDFSNSTNESSVLINAGIRFSQYIEQSTSGDLDMDRSFYHLNITGGAITDTIKLPEVITASDNWTSITSTQCGTGQEYVVTNARSAINLVISAYNPGGSGSDDLIGTRTQPGGSAGSAISIAPGKSAIIKCYGFTSNIGYWNYWLSN